MNGKLAILLVMAVACQGSSQPPPEPVPTAGVSLVISDTTPRPGQVITLRVDGLDSTIGLDTALDQWVDGEWRFTFFLIKDRDNEKPSYFRVGSGGGISIPDIGLDGNRDWAIQIPLEIEPGQYRLREEVSPQMRDLTELAVQIQIAES